MRLNLEGQFTINNVYPVADPGFSFGGHQPPTQALFGENVCENERIGSRWGGRTHRRRPPLGSANDIIKKHPFTT